MFEKVAAKLAEQLNVSVSKIKPESKIGDDLGADSLDQVELLMGLEDEYGIVIPDEDAEKIVTVQDIVDELEKLQK